MLTFFYGPLGLLVFSNMVLFSVTAVKLQQATRAMTINVGDDNNSSATMERRIVRRYSSNTFTQANYNRERSD